MDHLLAATKEVSAHHVPGARLLNQLSFVYVNAKGWKQKIMKRFFQPMAGASKKAKAGVEESVDDERDEEASIPDPLSFVTWNANSLLGRLRNAGEKEAFLKYVKDNDPDVIALQETWLPAATNPIRRVHRTARERVGCSCRITR